MIAGLAFDGTGLQTGLEPAQGSALSTRRARDVITFDRRFAEAAWTGCGTRNDTDRVDGERTKIV